MSSCIFRSPKHPIDLILTLIFTFIGLSVSEPSYQLLSTRLPKTLKGHITGIYRDTLFLFGGNPVNSEGDYRHNMQWYKLDLKSLQMSPNVDRTDITSVTGSWVEISGVTMPDYGPQAQGSTNEGQFWCARNQCSAVVGQYLFVVAPGYAESPYSKHPFIYRIDLSQDPPVFANQTDFQSTISGYGESVSCVTTDGTDLYYGGGCTNFCRGTYVAEDSVYKYDVSTDTHELAFAMSNNHGYRTSFGCAWNNHMYKVDGFRLYFVQGDDNTAMSGYLSDYEYYDRTTQSWSASISLPSANRVYTKCINNPFTSTVECGTGMPSYDSNNKVTLLNGSSFDRTVTLYQSVYQYTMEHYIIHLTATEGCAVMLVLGGSSDSGAGAVLDYMQYALRCYTIDGTDQPTADPTKYPTATPTAPSEAPTVPSIPPTTDPTIDPTPVTPSPVTPSPVTPSPITSSPTRPPVTPSPVTASPITSSPTRPPVTPSPITPVTPSPVTPSPITPSPVTASPVTSSPITSSPTTASPTAAPQKSPTMSPTANPTLTEDPAVVMVTTVIADTTDTVIDTTKTTDSFEDTNPLLSGSSHMEIMVCLVVGATLLAWM
eukprot:1001172_1